MRILPIILFFLYVYLEALFFVMVADSIGVLLALLGIIFTSIIGLSLVKSQGLKNLMLMQQKMANNEDPANELVKSVALLFAGFLLLIPGFLTDIIGAILLLSPVQQLVVRFIIPRMKVVSNVAKTKNNEQTDIIEGEFRRKDDE